MSKRHENPLDWPDKPEAKDFLINVNHRKLRVDIGNCALALFRHRPELDYIALNTLSENDPEQHDWIFIYDRRELVHWMGNLALHREDTRLLNLANRSHGTFYDRFGWNPDIVIEDYPSADEVEVYIDYITERGLEDPHADLNNALREDLNE